MKAVRSLFSRPRFAMGLVAVLVAIDQTVKWAVDKYLPFQEMVDVLPVLALFYTKNQGIAFSMLTGIGEKWLIALMLVVIGFVATLWARSTPQRWISQNGFAFIVAGAIGNLIDRAMHGYVVDYILVHAGSWYFAVFNLADAFITIGAVAIVVDEIFGKWLYPAELDGAE
ncbi:MAG: signal peptidase II [Hyphomicrobiales bacterium]|nr:signal peptidase II [Hyphomicrobiales bacterium]MCP4999181.1 signal peptidase II [Hyphomicrobiales bacterium]